MSPRTDWSSNGPKAQSIYYSESVPTVCDKIKYINILNLYIYIYKFLKSYMFTAKYEYDNYDSYLWTFIMILFLYETIKYKFTVIINRYLLHMIMVLFSTIKYIIIVIINSF